MHYLMRLTVVEIPPKSQNQSAGLKRKDLEENLQDTRPSDVESFKFHLGICLALAENSLPCGHMFGLSCLKKWIKDRTFDKCPECYENFSLESVTHLYAPRLCIPAPAAHKKNGDVLERHNDAMKRQTQLLNRMTDEEEWAEASEQQADAQKRAEVFRRKACALGQSADEYLRKADAFGQHAKALGQQAKSLRQLVDSYLAVVNGVKAQVDHISLFELDEAEKEVAEMELDLDDDDDDFEKVEDLTLPLVSKWDSPDDGSPLYGLEVPVMKDDEFILDSMYRNDIDIDIDIDDDDDDDDPPLPPHVFDPLPPPPAPVCSICFKDWTPLHHFWCPFYGVFSCLPCGHIFGFQCIQEWLQTNLRGTCPQCKALCSLKDVRTLYATRLCIPAADKGVVDPEISTRRFPFSRQGFVKFRKLESGRRNFALKKRSDAKKRLAAVVGRKNDLMKRQTDLLDRRASVLNRAKALEKQGGSLRLRADALRLRADALGRCADEYLRMLKP
ncbi:zinc finger, RING/FYVE/PHD-type containing protein [Tanacetum coccineum]